MNYFPDNWVVLKVDNFYKVLAGWSGGYAQSDSWRINSGISKVVEKDEYLEFIGESGSVYVCNKNSYGLRMNNAYIYNALKEKYEDRVQMLDENTNWLALV